ncbi:uncharacterized protein KQ657_003309 [Scheffersomyces spartinae]|uniref:PCI domain-containing protein n=1 Tax=Scheffersomyces spartinae TaxID=45513 RepID=A0A9P7VCP7_9ASCO|nr:uncharacterized protein KQ657_003309 [Scheffersomyces spartinae]KAG7195546.1 hypothetical protein KQ657_003309 [Scheffersomyces spartinae]
MENFSSDVPKIPDYKLSEKQFLLSIPEVDDRHRQETVEFLVEEIKKEKLGPYYKYLHQEYPSLVTWDEELYKNIAAENEDTINGLESKIKSAQDDETELDLYTQTMKLAEYYTRIIDRSNATETLKKALELTSNTGYKIDILLTLTRIEFFFNDYKLVKHYLDQSKTLIDKGGDWERRNRYKAYNGIYLLATRDFVNLSSLLIDSLATFTSTELCNYAQIAQYAIISGVMSLDRANLNTKIINSPEVLSISSTDDSEFLEPAINLTNSLYTCQYNYFFKYLLETHDTLILNNKYLRQHANYFLKEMRCKAYSQLLESYKSLSLKSMAHSFDISEDFLDEDLCKFIPNNKLNCTIDKVNGIIETNRPDNKNSQYHSLIKQGDGLLTKLQKYCAAVKLSGAERV